MGAGAAEVKTFDNTSPDLPGATGFWNGLAAVALAIVAICVLVAVALAIGAQEAAAALWRKK